MILLTDAYGRLGNRLYTLGHLIAFAEEHGKTLATLGFHDYAEHFPAFAGDGLCRYPPRRSWTRRLDRDWLFAQGQRLARLVELGLPIPQLRTDEEICLSDDPRMFKALVVVGGWGLRDAPLFAKHSDAVRRALTPRELSHAQAHAERARDGADVLLGLHVRRGDYATAFEGDYFFGGEDYARLVASARDALGGRVRVMVCTDDPDFSLDADDVVPGPGDLIGDLYGLAFCDRIMGPPSTFSGWASFWGRVPTYHVEDAAQPVATGSFRYWQPS